MSEQQAIKTLSPLGQQCLQKLMMQWFEFERQLGRVPIIKRLQNGQFNKNDYQNLLINLRQQVIEGSRWISRTASSFDRDYSDVRSMIIGHATEEHKDYQLLEKDFVASGGKLDDILNAQKNIGSEALHGFLMYKASLPNPIDLIGAMWIIEGLGQKMASDWSEKIDELIGGNGKYTKFMKYHGENDDDHLQKLYDMVDRVCKNEQDIQNIIQTCKVVARLYALQLEEIEQHI